MKKILVITLVAAVTIILLSAVGKPRIQAKQSEKTQPIITTPTFTTALETKGKITTAPVITKTTTSITTTAPPRTTTVTTTIGKMTGDEALASGAAEFFNACRTVRHYRIEILKMIAKAISDSLSMKKPVPGSPLEIVYNNVENLSYMMEIETIHELDEAITVSINMLNKPINLTEMEMLV